MTPALRFVLPAILAIGAIGPASAEKGATCQRACLEAYVDHYLAAMRDHKVDPALFAANVRFTENGVELPFGSEGLWATASGVGHYTFTVPDTETQQVAFLGTVLERTPIPEGQRQSRADLIHTANQYFDAIQRNTGKGYYPFSDDCVRHENGMVTAGPPDAQNPKRLGCKAQLQTSMIGAVTGIRDRRFVAVDRERGIVFAFTFFDHRPIDWTWELGELFKIEGDKIRRVEAIFIRSAYGLNSGWSTYQQTRSEAIQDVR